MLALLLACAPDPAVTSEDIAVLTDLSQPMDECALPCVALSGPAGTVLSLTADNVLLDSGTIGDDGLIDLCPDPGSVSAGATLTIEQEGIALVTAVPDIRPFGYAMGRERTWGAPDALEWQEGWVLDAYPIFGSQPESWYHQAITSPQRSGDRLYFSGKPTDDAPYRLGMVELDGESVVAPAEAPLLEPASGDWDAAGQVSPTLIEGVDGETLLLYQGLSESAEVPVLGRASSADGLTWIRPESGTYGDPISNKISHPTALLDESGVIELWHLTDVGLIGLSLSEDGGHTFTPSCVALPMRGKSPEVSRVGDRTIMTWATQSDGEDIVRWAESFDGIRWLENSEPILQASDSSWTADGLSNAQLTWIDGAPRLLLVGVYGGQHTFGFARPESEK
ncbi:MAG: hypothetical protein ACI8RZ_001784 [Myxococcota bacterium]|jgi:hypothetical protein